MPRPGQAWPSRPGERHPGQAGSTVRASAGPAPATPPWGKPSVVGTGRSLPGAHPDPHLQLSSPHRHRCPPTSTGFTATALPLEEGAQGSVLGFPLYLHRGTGRAAPPRCQRQAGPATRQLALSLCGIHRERHGEACKGWVHGRRPRHSAAMRTSCCQPLLSHGCFPRPINDDRFPPVLISACCISGERWVQAWPMPAGRARGPLCSLCSRRAEPMPLASDPASGAPAPIQLGSPLASLPTPAHLGLQGLSHSHSCSPTTRPRPYLLRGISPSLGRHLALAFAGLRGVPGSPFLCPEHFLPKTAQPPRLSLPPTAWAPALSCLSA